MEFLWNMMEAIIDTHIKKAVIFHDILHGFRASRETGTAIIKLKLAQEMESVDQEPLFWVLLDLRKSYDNLDRGRLMKTLEGYGSGPKIRDVLAGFWAQQEVVTRHNGYHGPQFRATHGTTQKVMT